MSLFTRQQLSRDSGACLECSGKGSQKAIDFPNLVNFDRLTTDISFLNLANNGKAYKYVNLQNSYLPRFAKENSIDTNIVFDKMSKIDQDKILLFLADKLEKYLDHDNLQEFITDNPCSYCQGSGFNHYARSVFYRNKTISDALNLTIAEALLFFAETELQPTLRALNKLALSHIALDRRTNTLSGGELQRLKLVEVIIRRAESLLLIIDEPSVGLHLSDLNNLLSLFRDLVSQNNTLLIIDHHPCVIANSNHHIEIGPDSGAKGGMLVATRKLETENRQLSIKKKIQETPNKASYNCINHHNIHRESLDFPLNKLVCLVGVSGSGKSSLAHYISENSKNHFDEVISLNQFAIGRNNRSTISTYLGIADQLRIAYVSTEQSQLLGLTKSDFNSNIQVGACKICAGSGEVNDMPCYSCDGQKCNPFILSITIDDKNISELLQIPIDELSDAAPTLFSHKQLNTAITTLVELGLGHLTLGRDIPSISGGEAQRVKLAKYLVQNNNAISNADKHNLLILDEPSQGLNSTDSLVILELLNKLVGYKNSLLVIEHNDIIIEQADFIIEMGPQAGHLGGKITFVGQVENYFRERTKCKAVLESTTTPANRGKLYPSAVINNQADATYFEILEGIYSSYHLAPPDHKGAYFSNKNQMHQHIVEHFATSTLFFNPFSSFFINSQLISRDEIESTLLRLKKFMLKYIYISGTMVSLNQASELIDNTNCWSVLVEAKDFSQAFELGCGWIVTQSEKNLFHLSVPMLSLQNRILAPKAINKNSFNLFYNKCPYCDGRGKVEISERLIADPKLSILDAGFYQSDLAPVIKIKLLRKLKLIVSTFKQQKLFDFYKPFAEFTGEELVIYHQGLPSHQFVKKNGLETANRDIITWPGMVNFLLDNAKYFSAQRKQQLLDIVTCKQCAVCGGSKYNQRLNYYFTQAQKAE
jgi:excinuclease ABC subunit A